MWGVNFAKSREILYEFLQVDDDDLSKMMKKCKIGEEDFRRKTEDLYEWARNHPDLPTPAKDEIFLRQELIQSKFDSSRARKKSEGFFKLMQDYPEIFRNLATVKYQDESALFLISPVRTPDFERVFIFYINPENAHKNPDGDKAISMISTIIMLVLENDISCGIRIIADFQNLKYQHTLSFNPAIIWKLIKLYSLGGPSRINGIELINTSNYVTSCFGVVKSLFSYKLISRITVHKNLDSLYEVIPKKCLPSEIGGDLGPIQNWIKSMDKIVDGYKEAAEKVATFVPPEAPAQSSDEQDFFYGTFM